MAATKYTYSISTAFPNHAVAPDRLLHEIQASAITVAVDRVDTSGDDCDVWFKAELGAEDLAALNSIVAAHSGIPLPEAPSQVMIAGSTTVLPIQALPPAGLKSNQISQNWCDKTTWWYSSIKVTDEVATTTDPERKIWKVVHPFMIDVCHGKLTGERTLTSHRVAVTVGGVAKTEQDPHHGTGDYVVDYAAGTLTFTDAIADGVSPLVSYHYENGSTWIIKPTAGETWRLKGAESQFSDDVIMNDAMVYEIWVINPADPPNLVMACEPDYYNTISDFINDANKAYPAIPALGGSGWRGSKRPVTVFSWDFQTTTDIRSDWGMELRVRLEHDTPYGGTFATGTFYFIRNDVA